MKDGSHFRQDFKSYMFDYENETEFENVWKKMIQEYIGESVSCLDSIYKLKTNGSSVTWKMNLLWEYEVLNSVKV